MFCAPADDGSDFFYADKNIQMALPLCWSQAEGDKKLLMTTYIHASVNLYFNGEEKKLGWKVVKFVKYKTLLKTGDGCLRKKLCKYPREKCKIKAVGGIFLQQFRMKKTLPKVLWKQGDFFFLNCISSWIWLNLSQCNFIQ